MFSTTVAQNIAYGLLARGEPKARVAQAVEQAMAWAGVERLRDTDPARLSGGQAGSTGIDRSTVKGIVQMMASPRTVSRPAAPDTTAAAPEAS